MTAAGRKRPHVAGCTGSASHQGPCKLPGDVIHRLKMQGVAVCEVREFAPGKRPAQMTSLGKFVTCPACMAYSAEKRAKAKAEFLAIGGAS
jgi:hypothetical protein